MNLMLLSLVVYPSLKNIPKWMELLTKEYTSKGILHDYTSANIPASKKKLNVNGAEAKDKPTDDDEVISQWKKAKKPNSVETKVKKKITCQNMQMIGNQDSQRRLPNPILLQLPLKPLRILTLIPTVLMWSEQWVVITS